MPNYKKISKNIERVIIDNPNTSNDKLIWINITNSGKQEIEYLRKNYNFDLAHLHASMSKISAQRPSIAINDNYKFLILHFPIFRNGSIVASEIDFFIKHGLLATSHNGNIPALGNFFNLSKKDGGSLLSYKFESAAILLYELLEKLIIGCYPLLDKNSKDITRIEETIFAQKQKEAVSQILDLRRNIINFRKIMQNHKNILKRLMEIRSELVPADEMKKRYKELVDHSKRIWETLENQKEMIETLNDTNESLINYRLNDIMKTLTIFSVIVIPLTLLASIFGMNTVTSMPFVESPYGFWVLLVIMLIAGFSMLIFFKKKKWL